MTWVLVLALATGPIVLARDLPMEVCIRNASRIEERHKADPSTYPGLQFVHCERIDR